MDQKQSMHRLGGATQVQEKLLSAIGSTRYAPTIRAAVNRSGHWLDLDYYDRLGDGARDLAIERIGKRIEDFKVTVKNASDDPELEPARRFLSRIVECLENAVSEAYKWIQVAAKDAFQRSLEPDRPFWRSCQDRWGLGRGYREAIRVMTANQFRSNYGNAHQTVRILVLAEWSRIIELLEGMSNDGGDRSADTSSST